MNQVSKNLARDIQQATANLELAIAELRSLAVESVEVPYGPNLSLLIPPANDDDRLTVKRAGHGFTCVNYGVEGLIVDVYGNDEIENCLVHTAAIESSELRGENGPFPVIDFTKTVTLVVPAHACSDYGNGPSAASIVVDAEFISRLQSLRDIKQSSGHIDKIVSSDAPNWLPAGMVEDFRLQCQELVVSNDSFWYQDRPQHADYNIESDIISFDEMMEAYNGAADGETVVLGSDDFKEHVAEMLEDEGALAHG